jgi:hypothetical protein
LFALKQKPYIELGISNIKKITNMSFSENRNIKLIVNFLWIFLMVTPVYSTSHVVQTKSSSTSNIKAVIIQSEKPLVLQRADSFLLKKPITVTTSFCLRSAGGIHDYYSEGTYWWPDPKNPNGPYIRKDGLNNPDNFKNDLLAIERFSWIVGTETSAYLLTGKKKYANAAISHLKAWFIDTTTLMNPNMLYTQAIKGVNTGRGIGIIDAAHLIDVAKSVEILEQNHCLTPEDYQTIKQWFQTFLTWLTTHPYGITEMHEKNNHGTWWHVQAAAYAQLVGDESVLQQCRSNYEDILLPHQMAQDGSFPLEIKRTKPYGYSLFNLDGMAILSWLITNKSFDGWNYTLPDGRGMRKGVAFMKSFVKNKNLWPYKKDVAHWNELPGRRPFMIFAAIVQNQLDWISIWKAINPHFQSAESRRNMPLKNPLLWIGLIHPLN